jgi:hypothetical protein
MLGMRIMIPIAATTAMILTNTSDMRQLIKVLATRPSGTPTAVADVNPPMTTARARPFSSGRTSAAATAPALGV